MDRQFDLVAIGDVCIDLIVRGAPPAPIPGRELLVESAQVVLGGSTCLLAAAAARLGLRVAIVGLVGADAVGQFARGELTAAGVHVGALLVDPSIGTGITISLSGEHERALLTSMGTIPHLSARQIPVELLGGARHLHVSSYFLQKALQADCATLFRHVHALGLTTSLDTGDDPDDRWGDGLRETLATVDMFFPNEREALRISGEDGAERALGWLADFVPVTVVKLGAAGAIARVHGEQMCQKGYRVRSLDTTGAGDVFNAGYLWGYLQGQPPGECLRRAAAAGALATTWAGGQGPRLSSAAVLQLIEEQEGEWLPTS
jgi:sugar/nucleoside kinase (ribokinase family)